MCRRWFLLLIPLFIPAGTTLDEEATVAPSSKMEDMIPGDMDNSNAHQLFKRRFTGYKDFNKYKFTKSKSRIHRFFLRNPYDTLVRTKRSNSGMLRLLKTLFANHSEEKLQRNDNEQINLPVSIRDNAISDTENAEDDDSKEENALNNKLFSRIDKTLTRLNNKLEAMEKEKENAFIMFKVPVPIDDYRRKSRAKRETNEPDENIHDDDSNITVIALTKSNNQQTTTEPNTVSKVEEEVEDTSNNTIVAVSLVESDHNETKKNESASLVEPQLDTNKTEVINNEEIDNNTLTLAELNDTRRSYKPNDDDYIIKMGEILDDIHIKLSPLKKIKEAHIKDEKYKVGYIIANLESAEETIARLLSKLKTRETLPHDQAQSILDKVTISSMVVSNLMNFLGRSNPPSKS